uniref:NADH-ubiquinone oxidoreductase chain 4L n=1 Tax=Trametes cingulata TaxID=575983 RepID=D3YNM7_9APHY|nr:NADH dehydrogenase subunit 4L [Trametes cingulata]ADD21051.1 NADH dehydrogenase subunit 4L [Trametes cingulata]
MNLSLFLFLIGVLGFILNRKNIILMIIAIEMMLLAVTLLVLISSFSFDDAIGQNFSIFIISIAGAESVIGLSILVAFYRFNSSTCSYCYLMFKNTFLYNSLFNKASLSYNTGTVISPITQQSRKYYNYLSQNSQIDPLFITGLFDAEGSFLTTIFNNSRY